MEKLTFNCEVITPMFLAGADGATPELRPASIKGALRFWWRAMHGELEWKKLAEEEGKIFGDTKQRSSILIRIDKKLSKVSKDYLLPHKMRENERSIANCFPASELYNESFEVTLTLVNNNCGLNVEQVKSLFILTCILGGFGKRSRRGAGSVNVKSLEFITKINQGGNVETAVNNKVEITPIESLESILNLINEIKINKYKLDKNAIIPVNPSEYKNEFPYIKEIKIGSSIKAIKDIGLATHDIMNSEPFIYKTTVGAGKPRLASPVYISILQNLHPVITTLNLVSKGNKNYSLQTALKSKLL
jgi:CRISPR-associated protein Cmr1